MITAAIWLAWFCMLDIIQYCPFKHPVSRTVVRVMWTTAALLGIAAVNR